MILEIFISTLYLALALLQLFLAPRVGPNPYFGFKIGYTFSNPVVWRKSNRLVGLLMLMHAVPLLFLSFLDISLFLYLALFLIPLLLITAVGIIYASRKLEEYGKGEIEKIEPIKPLEASFIWKHLGLILFFILLLLMAITYNSLPDTIAVHFDASGKPNGWADKNDFIFWYTIFALIYLSIVYILVYIGRKYPIILHSGVMRIGRDTVFKSSLLAMNLVILIIILAYMGIYFFNTEMTGGGIINYVVILTFMLVFLPIGYIVYRWNEERKEVGM